MTQIVPGGIFIANQYATCENLIEPLYAANSALSIWQLCTLCGSEFLSSFGKFYSSSGLLWSIFLYFAPFIQPSILARFPVTTEQNTSLQHNAVTPILHCWLLLRNKQYYICITDKELKTMLFNLCQKAPHIPHFCLGHSLSLIVALSAASFPILNDSQETANCKSTVSLLGQYLSFR